MKLYISADMEGITGLAEYRHILPNGPEFYEMVNLWTRQINAIVEAAVEVGVEEVLINEAHSAMNYLKLGSLHPKASLITGYVKADNQMHGLDQSFLGGIFIGHARAGVAEATLNHTYVMRDVYEIRLNGDPIGEIGLNALWAAYVGSALILVVGDEKAASEAQAFEKTIQAAIVKEGISQFSAKHYSVEKACEIIAKQTKNAVEMRQNNKIFPPELPDKCVMEIDFSISEIAHLCSFVPGVDRMSARTIRFENTDYRLLQQIRIVCTNLALATTRGRF